MWNESTPSMVIRVVLDSNIYIDALTQANLACVQLVERHLTDFDVKVPLFALLEAGRNLGRAKTQKLYSILRKCEIEPDYQLVPKELIQRYERLGGKKGDAVIAAYTELIGADYLVTQNRRFLKDVQNLPFTIIEAAQAIQLVSPEEEG